MLTKGKKPELKEEAKDATEAPPGPVRAETPRLLRAALEMTERSSGLKGALAKVKEKTNKSSISLQVHKKFGQTKEQTCTPVAMIREAVSQYHLFPLPALRLFFPASSISHLQLRTRQRRELAITQLCNVPLCLSLLLFQQLCDASLGFTVPCR